MVLLVAALLSGRTREFPLNGLSIALALLCSWLLADAVWFSPHYAASGIYRPAILMLAFAVGALLERTILVQVFIAGTALLSGLVLFGLMQVLLGFRPYEDAARAAAAFATPNTFAAAINLFLLPLLALMLSGRGNVRMAIVALWLFAGLLSTGSRGAWLAFGLAAGFIVACQAGDRSKEGRTRWGLAVAGGLFATGFGYYALKVASLGNGVSSAVPLLGTMAGDIAGRGYSYRVELARVALAQIAERPITGFGANTFWPLYEMVKPHELDQGMTFPFAHNDYLQTWLEYGLPGIVLLCAVVGAAYVLVLRQRKTRPDPLVTSAGAAATGLFTHALVDFPLYIPFLLAVLGIWLGALAAFSGDTRWLATPIGRLTDSVRSLRTRLVATGILVAVLAWLSQPALAEVAARRALSELRSGRVETGLYWQTVARRLEPQSGRRHWEEGIVLRDQAVASGSRDLAARADAAFAEGARVDPYEANNFVERARLHRQNRGLLNNPASAAEIVGWVAHAARLRPYMLAAQLEYARTLAYAGRRNEAHDLAQALAARYPQSRAARALAAEI